MAKVTVRPARRGDLPFVREMIVKALTPYYDGDHSKHAESLMEAHLAGGRDKVGVFSREQRLFVLTDNGVPAGLVHLVGKRQGTWKISPLIVAESARGEHGYGTRLLRFAERYARQRDATQMYCTVAETNISALSFFRRHGYVVAGRARGQYMRGVVEVILYRSLRQIRAQRSTGTRQIKIAKFEARHADAVRALILKLVPAHFRTVNNAWVDALFRVHQRRMSNDVNQKFKLIFVATDATEKVTAAVAATPKKGGSVKLMPCVAEDIASFEVMLRSLPGLLQEFGRKLYLHCVPTVEETKVLQKLGWIIEALLPRAYNRELATQQWSLTLEEE